MTKEEFLKSLKTAIEHSDVPMRDSLLETFYFYHPEFRKREDDTMAEKERIDDAFTKFINGEKKAKFRVGQYIKYKGHIYEITKVEIGITGPFYTVRIVDEEHDFEGTVTGIGVGGEPDMEEVEKIKPFRWEPIDEDIDYVSKNYRGWLLTSDTLYHDGYKIRLYDLETRIKKNNN